VTKIISHVNSAPNIAIAIITVNAVSGDSATSTAATATPLVEIQSAARGTPFAPSRPNTAGARRARDRLNIIRVVTYSWLFIADSAAISSTKLITPAAYGTCVAAITFTNGLSSVPACVHGTIASISDSVSR